MLVKGNEEMFKSVAKTDNSNENQHGGNSIIVECLRGEEMWVKCEHIGLIYTTKRQNDFSGMTLALIKIMIANIFLLYRKTIRLLKV